MAGVVPDPTLGFLDGARVHLDVVFTPLLGAADEACPLEHGEVSHTEGVALAQAIGAHLGELSASTTASWDNLTRTLGETARFVISTFGHRAS